MITIMKTLRRRGMWLPVFPRGTGVMMLATHGVDFYNNDIKDNRSVGVAIVSYELVAAINEGVSEQPNATGGVQTVNNRFREDSLYNAFPYDVKIHGNRYENSHWFPSLSNDIGKLLMFKSLFNPPDVVYDGIENPKQKDRLICIH